MYPTLNLSLDYKCWQSCFGIEFDMGRHNLDWNWPSRPCGNQRNSLYRKIEDSSLWLLLPFEPSCDGGLWGRVPLKGYRCSPPSSHHCGDAWEEARTKLWRLRVPVCCDRSVSLFPSMIELWWTGSSSESRGRNGSLEDLGLAFGMSMLSDFFILLKRDFVARLDLT
jgi:hypothetical protein